jgi:hypothetical protein
MDAQTLDDAKDNLLLAFLRRLGGELTIPVPELDEAVDFALYVAVDEVEGVQSMSFRALKKG